jgi:macrolide-specific efflux system membrane fusion protein
VLPSPEVINEVVLYNALLDVDNRDRRLMTGMSVQVFFVLGRAENVPLVPMAALGKRLPDADDARGQAFEVTVRTAAGDVPRTVHVGLKNRRHAAVAAGLAAGDEVLLPASAPAGGMPQLPPRL